VRTPPAYPIPAPDRPAPASAAGATSDSFAELPQLGRFDDPLRKPFSAPAPAPAPSRPLADPTSPRAEGYVGRRRRNPDAASPMANSPEDRRNGTNGTDDVLARLLGR